MLKLMKNELSCIIFISFLSKHTVQLHLQSPERMLSGQAMYLSMSQLQQKNILSLVHCPWLCDSRLRCYVCEQKLKFSRDNGMDFTQDAVCLPWQQ